MLVLCNFIVKETVAFYIEVSRKASSSCTFKFLAEGNPATTLCSMPHSFVPLLILKYPSCHHREIEFNLSALTMYDLIVITCYYQWKYYYVVNIYKLKSYGYVSISACSKHKEKIKDISYITPASIPRISNELQEDIKKAIKFLMKMVYDIRWKIEDENSNISTYPIVLSLLTSSPSDKLNSVTSHISPCYVLVNS